MIVEECKIYKGFVAVLLLIILFSCTDETMISGNVEGAYISIRNIDSQNTTHSGSEEDYDVNTLRVLAFNKTTGACISNIHYSKNQWIENIIRHPIVAGNYDFVFLANEPTDNVIANIILGISSKGTFTSVFVFWRFVIIHKLPSKDLRILSSFKFTTST